MKSYLLIYNVPYEGSSEMSFYSLKNIQEWLSNNKGLYEYNLGNVSIYEIVKAHNPYEIINGEFIE